ncbi:MAG: ABC-2 family transporter protein [Lachnospiraceae bacterium]|nr:ABC-2 family transporter protein [Lachnospiraceae bacterium]MDE7183115.1 ABC-2 family transporter protein [Lachnospiraceae bacterium]
MLTAVKNQMRVCALAVKYNIMREMLNKVTFLTNILFMMFNNATFIVQWVILLRLREDVGGYTMRDVMLLWGLAASSFGLSRLLFSRVFSLPELIINGKLDAYLVQPKNVLLSVMTSATSASAIGDLAYGLLLVCIFCFSVKRLLLFLLFTVTGALIMTAFALLMGSLTFWFVRAEMFASHMVSSTISFATYPDGIFKGAARFLLYHLIPVGMAIYHPVHIMIAFDGRKLLAVLGYLVLLSAAAVFVFYRGLRRYSSSSLMQSGRV